MTMLRSRIILALVGLLLAGVVLPARSQTPAASYYLIDSFSVCLPSSENVTCSVNRDDVKVGLASAALQYRFAPARGQGTAVVSLPQEARPVPASGTLRFWVKGDGSGNQMCLQLRHAEVIQEPGRGRELRNHRELRLPWIDLNFDTWKEISLPLKDLPPGQAVWLSEIVLQQPKGGKDSGTILLDDLRLYPDSGTAPAIARLQLIGPAVRAFSDKISLSLDVRRFGGEAAKVQSHVTMVDRNDNLVVERDYAVTVSGGEAKEVELKLDPENLAVFLPPFRIKGEVFSLDLADLAARLDETLVMGNSYLLFEDFGNVFGRWFTSGLPFRLDANNDIFGEQQHAFAGIQTAAAISRVEIAAAPAAPGDKPPGRYAMKIDFNDRAMVYNGIHRYLPGDAYRMGVWVCGDGSGATLAAIILDFSAAGSTFYTWHRSFGLRTVCTLDFRGWRYCEVDLPGNGVGPRTLRGSSDAIDFPLDLSAFAIVPAKDVPTGTVLIGPIFLHTQQDSGETLSVQVGYDDPEQRYAPAHGAWATVQNGYRVSPRKVRAAWTLLDRDDAVITSGTESLDLPPMELRTFRIDLAAAAAKIASRNGPLRLQVTASDSGGAATAEEQIILAKPDSQALVTDFEADRAYSRLQAAGLGRPGVADSGSVSRTSTAQKHSGNRSLALRWQRGQLACAAIDPPLPGIPVTLSLWLYGDGSGALFYPLIGDQTGVVSGVESCQWDLFLPRTQGVPLQNAVAVDWQGWRQLTFLLPPVPRGWNDASPILPFVPSYPLGVHLMVQSPAGAGAAEGTLYVDDIAVQTHLEPAARLNMELHRAGESNVVLPGTDVEVTVTNREMPGQQAPARKAVLAGGLFDWRNERVAGADTAVELAAGESRVVTVAKAVPAGAYTLRLGLKEGDKTLASLAEDLLVANLAPVLGEQWPAALDDVGRLRAPLDDRFTFIEHDWDWAEFQPGNLQPETLLACVAAVRKLQLDPYVLLGYSTYWAAASGFEEMLTDRLSDRNSSGPGGRDWGHATDTFHVPERLDDWENYVYNLMRLAGRDVAGWVLWNTPDSQSSLGVPPARFAAMAKIADKWRLRYCPDTPLILGGLSRDTALPYLSDLAKADALGSFSGVNLRLDAGVISPEDSRIPEYVEELQQALDSSKGRKRILVTDLDWAVEKDGRGLGSFEQAAYLARANLLLRRLGADPTLIVQNQSSGRLGFGLLYKTSLSAPPLTQEVPALKFKPAWWGMVRLKQFLRTTRNPVEVEVQDVIPLRTRCVLYERTADAVPVAVVWRNNDDGAVSFAGTGLAVVSAEDLFGVPLAAADGWYRVGKVPSLFILKPAAEAPAQALARLHVRESDKTQSWPQQVLDAFAPATAKPAGYVQTGGKETELKGLTVDGRLETRRGLAFAAGGSEHLEVALPKGAGLVLRKRFLLDDTGQTAEVTVNGKARGSWNLKRDNPKLSGGIREACFVVAPAETGDGARAVVDVRYTSPANTASWTLLACAGGTFPLSALGAIHAESGVAQARLGRNIVGLPLQVGKKGYANGVGVFAPNLLEYPLNGQFSRFTAEVGIASLTEGKGSVVFEVYGDGKKLWASPVMSGLDTAKSIDVSVAGVDRLRLVVTDAGDGNRFDAANWCEPTLYVK